MIDPLPSDQFRIGDLLNNTYQIEGLLGRGGTGEVYRGRNQITGRLVAIKVLSRQFSQNADFVELMKREDEMRSIDHKAVVRYIECARAEGGQVFLVMEFIDGPSLGDGMESGRFDARELMIVAHRVAQGLVATHARGIVHRDLSPDNVILRDGRPEAATIIDFGIAKDTAAGARTFVGDQFAGKYEYAAPEQFEGRTDWRSDLYALGATLLAAWRGETPFSGATPGELVRRKMAPLDLSGVPEPLADLIGWLTAPDPDSRPAHAAELVERLEALLATGPSTRSETSAGHGRAGSEASSRSGRAVAPQARGSRLLWPAAVVLAVASIAAAYFGGLFDRFFTPSIPVAAPYTLTAAAGPEGEGTLVTNAPDEEAGRLILDAYAEAAGGPPAAPNVMLATGMPTEAWPDAAAGLLREFHGLEAWALTLHDQSLRANGVAPDSAARDAAAARIGDFAEGAGMDTNLEIRAGPLRLPAADLAAVLEEVATCGPLTQHPPESGVYGMDDPVRVTGALSSGTDEEAVRGRIGEAVGDRQLSVETTSIDPPLCTVRESLPAVGSGQVSVWLGDGETGAANLGGIFRTGQNPIAEVQVPAGITEGYLWVMVVDTSGIVYNLLPSEAQEDNRLSELGVVDGGIRRIRILWPRQEAIADPSRFGFVIDDEDYGKSEIIAILTHEELFPARRPPKESAESLADALAEALAARPDVAIALATRLIDARQ